MATPAEYLAENPMNGGTLYYPGALTDVDPFAVFGFFGLDRFIYTDFAIAPEEMNELFRTLGSTTPEPLQPRDFQAQDWEAFMHPSCPRNPDGATMGMKTSFSRRGRSGASFEYLKTEGVGTYSVLVRDPIRRPTVVVLQDHGMGGNWTTFGGDRELFQIAQQNDALPLFLYVAQNTQAWPGYQQITNYADAAGAMHAHPRALFSQAL